MSLLDIDEDIGKTNYQVVFRITWANPANWKVNNVPWWVIGDWVSPPGPETSRKSVIYVALHVVAMRSLQSMQSGRDHATLQTQAKYRNNEYCPCVQTAPLIKSTLTTVTSLEITAYTITDPRSLGFLPIKNKILATNLIYTISFRNKRHMTIVQLSVT